MLFARVRVKGKLIRRSLKMKFLSEAKMRLADLEKSEHQMAEQGSALARGKMIFGDALKSYRQRLHGDASLKPRTKAHREERISLKADRPNEPADARVMKVSECNGSLSDACRRLGIPRITHHDLRHLFATACIESGVDIPTVSRWLGHKDGGALAMKVYGHPRNEHSQEMARKVKY